MSGLNAPQQLPTRQKSFDDDDVAADQDASEVTKLFHERLQAWKHACGYLEDYVSATERMHKDQHKEYEKILKTVSNPLKEGEHFDQQMGGINEVFDNLRSNTQGLANSNTETAKNIKGSVLPIFERLHQEIKAKQKELAKGVGKGTKAVDKARGQTQKHIEKLGQQTAAHGATGSTKVDPSNDPYVLHKGVFHLLNKQILEENSTRQDMITVQSNFSQFEAHVVQTFQQGIGHLMQTLNLQLDSEKSMYTNMTQKAQGVSPLFEWNNFVNRKNDILIDPNAPARNVDSVNFPNKGAAPTQAAIQGSLERKSGLIKSWSSGFYAVTPAGFLHEFKTDDHFAHEPKPETSLYLPDCVMGGLNGQEFAVKGKDKSSTLATKSEYKFRAHTTADAEQWYKIIHEYANGGGRSASGSEVTSPISPSSPVGSRNVSGAGGYGNLGQPQESGTTSNIGTAHSTSSPTAGTGYASHASESAATNAPSSTGGAGASGVGGNPGEY